MRKKKILLLIPLLLIAGLILYTWITVLTGDNVLVWRHYTGLILFVPLIYLFTKNFRKTILGTVIYLIFGICNVLTLTPSIIWNSYGIRIGSANIETPPFQLLSFGLLILLCVLNFDTLVDIYLDFKEMRQKTKIKESIQVDKEKVLISGTNFKKEIAWNEITQINIFKKDFLTTDRIELEIVYDDKSLTINEDVEGWDLFITKAKEMFATMPKDWDTIIINPPFETNFRTIYSKV
jgi:hypothetical protein